MTPEQQAFHLECEALQLANQAVRDLNKNKTDMALLTLETAVSRLLQAKGLRLDPSVDDVPDDNETLKWMRGEKPSDKWMARWGQYITRERVDGEIRERFEPPCQAPEGAVFPTTDSTRYRKLK